MSWIPFWLQDVQLSTSQSLVPKQGIKQPGRRSPKPGSGWLWFSSPTAVNQSKTKQNVQPSSMPKYRRWQQHPANIWAFLQWGEKTGLQICIQRVKGLQRCLRKRCRKVFSEGQWILLHPTCSHGNPVWVLWFDSCVCLNRVFTSPPVEKTNKQNPANQRLCAVCYLTYSVWASGPSKAKGCF